MSRQLTIVVGGAGLLLAMVAIGAPSGGQVTGACAPPRACSSVRREEVSTAPPATTRRAALDSTETGLSRGQKSLIGGAVGFVLGAVVGYNLDGGCGQGHYDGEACVSQAALVTTLGILSGPLGLIVGAIVGSF